MTTRIAWFNCQAGVAGDMTMAALVDAGADRDFIGRAIGGLGVDGYALLFERVQRGGIAATWANVVVDDHDHDPEHHDGAEQDGHSPHRAVREIIELLDAADLPERVRARARAVFVRLGEVEGAIHGVDPEDVELHEVGSLDSIIDVVGACAALESLDIDEIWCGPVGLGTGTIRSAHGLIPNPAPATMRLLTDAEAPIVGLGVTMETATPTGAALMTALADGFGAVPAMTPTAVGYGAGTADLPNHANLVQVVVGVRRTTTDPGAEVTVLEANVDDVTGEVLGHAIATLMAAGAFDAWVTPIIMKKGRPAHIFSVMCNPATADELRRIVVRETGTLGVRATTTQRWPEPRTTTTVQVDGHSITCKVTAGRIKVEFDDAARAAAALDIPVRVVIERSIAAAIEATTP